MIDVTVFESMDSPRRLIHLNPDLVACVELYVLGLAAPEKRATAIWVSPRDPSGTGHSPSFMTEETVESLTRRLKSGFSMKVACELEQFDRYCWHPSLSGTGQEAPPRASGLLAAMKTLGQNQSDHPRRTEKSSFFDTRT